MEQNVMDNVSSNIKRFRKALELYQDDIATRMHIARPVISNWESRKSEPSTSQLTKLAQILNVSLDTLVYNKTDGKQVVIIDTSMLIKRPAIIREVMEKFDEIIVPQVVINELNYRKDNGKPCLKKQVALIMHLIDDIKNKDKKLIIQPSLQKDKNAEHDVQISNIAIERASKDFVDKVYVFANDIWFSFLVKEERANLYLLTYDEYKNRFLDNEDFYDIKKTQEFMSLIKEKKWKQIELIGYDSEIDINYIDPETGYTPLIQAIRYQNIDIIRFLIEKYRKIIDLDRHDNYKYKFTPLLHTAQMRRIDMMRILVEEGADIDVGSTGDNSGNTPLMVSAWHGFYEGAKFLVEQGACLNQQDSKAGFSALIKACFHGHYDIAALLINETDVNIRSRENKKAIEYIKLNKKNSLELYSLFKGK
jgi:ankyrin repeat protein/transcriptional regulator with XRE-family HTH domain